MVIMWSITMCRSEKSQCDFDMSVRERANSDVGLCMLKSHYAVTSGVRIEMLKSQKRRRAFWNMDDALQCHTEWEQLNIL